MNFPGDDQKPLEEGGRDIVMAKLGETIQPMKESFIVAFLAWKGAREEDMVVPKEIQDYREAHNVTIDFEPDGADGKEDAELKKTSEDEAKPVQTNSAQLKKDGDENNPCDETNQDQTADEANTDNAKVKEESTEKHSNESKEKPDVSNAEVDEKYAKTSESSEGRAATEDKDVAMKDSDDMEKPKESVATKEETAEKKSRKKKAAATTDNATLSLRRTKGEADESKPWSGASFKHFLIFLLTLQRISLF